MQQNFNGKTAIGTMPYADSAAVRRRNLFDKQQSQTVTLFCGIVIANHIVGSMIQLFDLFVCGPHAVVGNKYRAGIRPGHNPDKDMTALLVVIDAVL